MQSQAISESAKGTRLYSPLAVTLSSGGGQWIRPLNAEKCDTTGQVAQVVIRVLSVSVQYPGGAGRGLVEVGAVICYFHPYP